MVSRSSRGRVGAAGPLHARRAGKQFVVVCRLIRSPRREYHEPAIFRELQPEKRLVFDECADPECELECQQRKCLARALWRRNWSHLQNRKSAREWLDFGLLQRDSPRYVAISHMAIAIAVSTAVSENS